MPRVVQTILLVLALVLAAPAQATPRWTPYSPEAFAAAQDSGKLVLVDVWASWCPTCKAQQPILEELRQDTRLADAVFIKLDFDREKAFLKSHRIPRQSTILAFRGEQEVLRSIAETDRLRLRSAVLGAL